MDGVHAANSSSASENGAGTRAGNRYNWALPQSESMPVSTVLHQSNLPGLNLIHRGKVRDVYALSARELLIVATDRLSAFDVVLPDPIPGKGEMLCQISNFWFGRTAQLMPNHLTGKSVATVLPPGTDVALYEKRSVVGRPPQTQAGEGVGHGDPIGGGGDVLVVFNCWWLFLCVST